MKEFNLVATGGTFDIIHNGHIALLLKSFMISKKVIIGLTSDKFAFKKYPLHNYSQRSNTLIQLIQGKFPNEQYQISKLENDFGPAVLEKNMQALVVSEETHSQGDILNDLRLKKNLPPVKIITVPMVLAKDGIKISTSRIRNSEINPEGNLLI